MASKQIEFDAVVSASQINKLLTDLRTGAEGAAKAINDALGGTVTKKIVFEEVVNDKGIKQLVATEKQRLTVADQLINRQNQLNKTQEGSKTNLQQLLNNLKQQRDGVARYETSINSIGNSIRKQTSEWTALNAQVSTVQRQLDVAAASGFWQRLKVETRTQGLINIGNGLVEITNQLQAASIIVGQLTGAIGTLVDSAAQIQSFSLAFQAIGAGGGGAIKALQESSRIALGLGVDLNTVQEGFKQLSPVVLNIGGTLGDVSGIIESLSSRFAAFGIAGDRARRVTQGVIQAFAKGKLQAEELTQQISEADPAFKTDFAKALFAARKELGQLGKEVDGSTANLEKLVKAGKITGDVLIRVLPGLSKSSLLFGKLGPTAGTAVDALEKGSTTIDQVRSNLKNLNQLSLRNIAQSAEPLINSFLRVQAVVADFFSRISKSSAFEAFANIAARIVGALTRLADVFFVVVEGALAFVEAIKPILDLLANVPGLAEAVGIAILGKIIAPFKLFEKRILKTKVALTSFTASLKGSFASVLTGGFIKPQRELDSFASSLDDVRSEFSKPVKGTAVVASTDPGVSKISNSATEAIADITGVGRTSAAEIDSLITSTENRIAKLKNELDEATKERASRLTSTSKQPTGQQERQTRDLKESIAKNEATIERLKQSAASIKQQSGLQSQQIAFDIEDIDQRVSKAIGNLAELGRVQRSTIEGNLISVKNDIFKGQSTESLQRALGSGLQQIEKFESEVKSKNLGELIASAGFGNVVKTEKQQQAFLAKQVSDFRSTASRVTAIAKELESRGIQVGLKVVKDPSSAKNLNDIEKEIANLELNTFSARKELEALQATARSGIGGLDLDPTVEKLQGQIERAQNSLENLYEQRGRGLNLEGISATATQAVASVSGASKDSIAQIDSLIKRTQGRIKELEQSLAGVEPKTQAPTALSTTETRDAETLRSIIAENEKKVEELQQSAIAIRESTAGLVRRIEVDVDDLQSKVDDGIDSLSRLGTISASSLAFKPEARPGSFENFNEDTLRKYLQTQKQGIENFNKLAQAGDLAGIAASKGFDLAGKTQQQINDFLSLTTSSIKSQASAVRGLQLEFQKRGLSFDVETIDDAVANKNLGNIETQISSLEAAASKARLELEALQAESSRDAGRNGLSAKEKKRQEELQREIRVSRQLLNSLSERRGRITSVEGPSIAGGGASIERATGDAADGITTISRISSAEIEGLILQSKGKIGELREELSQLDKAAALGEGTGSSLSKAEEKRRKSIEKQLEAENAQLANLRSQRKESQAISSLSIKPPSVAELDISKPASGLEQYLETLKKTRFQEELAANPRYAKNLEEIAKKSSRLVEIEKERGEVLELSARSGAKVTPGGFKVQETQDLRDQLRKLQDENSAIQVDTLQTVASQLDLNSAFDEAARAGSTYEQRQRAIQKALNATDLIIKETTKGIAKSEEELSKLAGKRDEIVQARREARGGLPRASGRIEADFDDQLRNNARAADEIRGNIAKLNQEQGKATGIQLTLGRALKANEGTIDNFGNKLKRLGGAIGSTASNLAGPLVGGLNNLKQGIAGIISSIDPLTGALIAAGIVSRLYADGNKEAAAAAAEFQSTLDRLNATRNDILPGSDQAEKSQNALQRAYSAIAISTVTFVDTINLKLQEAGRGFFGFVESARESLPVLESNFVKVAASIALVAGAAAAGAKAGASIGAVLGSPTGPGAAATTGIGALVGGVIASISALFTAIALGSDNTLVKLDELKKKLKEIREGGNLTAEAADSLTKGLLSRINLNPTQEVDLEDINKLKKALESVKEARDQIEGQLSAAKGRKVTSDAEIKRQEKEIEGEKEKLKLIQQARAEAEKGVGGRGGSNTKARAEVRILARAEEDLSRSIDKKTQNLDAARKKSEELGQAQISLQGNYTSLTGNIDELNAAIKTGETINENFISTLEEIEARISTLQGKNKTIEFTTPEGLASIRENIQEVKNLQKLTEEISKTKIEIEIETRGFQAQIADAQIGIDFDDGPLRDALKLATEVSKNVQDAGTKFSGESARIAQQIKDAQIDPAEGSRQLVQAGREFLATTRASAETLAKAGRDLQEKLTSSVNSLSNLKLSKPEFFSPQELAQNAEEIRRRYQETIDRVGFAPTLKPGTETEILQQQLSFVETRDEADRLIRTIQEIPPALTTIIGLLATITGTELEALQAKGLNVKKIIEDSQSAIESFGASTKSSATSAGQAISRIGEVVGEISGGGQALILYYDKVTKQVETVTKAEFEARQEAEKLANAAGVIGQSFAGSTGTAVSALDSVQSKASATFGEVSKTGKTQVSSFGALASKIEDTGNATMERLSKEKLVTEEAQKQSEIFEAQLKFLQSRNATRPPVASSGASGRSSAEPKGGFVFFPDNMESEAEGSRKMRELAERVGGDYLGVLSEVIRTGGFGAFPEMKVASIARDFSSYRAAVESVGLAQEQAAAAQKRYNDAIRDGGGDLTSLAANSRNANDALAQAKLGLESAEVGFKAASELAAQLGININTIPQIGQFLPAPEETGNALQQWQNYVNGVSSGSQQLQTSSSAAQQQWNDYVNSVTAGSQQIGEQSSADAFSPLVESAKNATIQGGQVLQQWGQYVQEVQSGIRSLSAESSGNPVSGLTNGANTASEALQGATGSSEAISSNFDDTAERANEIRNSLLELNGKTIEIFVKQTPLANPRFAGGPVVGGQSYQVNELGQEGFLSAAGRLSKISAPAYGTWRAPGAGTVIPAHIMDKLNVPQAGIKVNTEGKSVKSNNGMQQIMRTMFAAISASRTPENAINELASVQANQAVQIGKLSRVVNKLAEKDWNVNVQVRPGSSSNYMNALNSRL